MKPALEATEIQTPADKTPMPPCPETHLAKAIVFTALMCFPFGIPAIVNAAGVHTAYAPQAITNLPWKKARKRRNGANILLSEASFSGYYISLSLPYILSL